MKNTIQKIIVVLVIVLCSNFANAQTNNLDKIAAIIGDNILVEVLGNLVKILSFA